MRGRGGRREGGERGEGGGEGGGRGGWRGRQCGAFTPSTLHWQEVDESTDTCPSTHTRNSTGATAEVRLT